MSLPRARWALGLAFSLIVAWTAPAALRAASSSEDRPAVPASEPELRALPETATRAPAEGNDLPMSAADRALAKQFPYQYEASESAGDARTRAWALLIGINEYAGRTQDAIGSRQDAQMMRKHLLNLGWRSDHIMLITDKTATASKIVSGLRWLQSKTTSQSTVIFHYAGHEMPRYNDPDKDGEYRDVEFWATDNRYVIDRTVGRHLNAVRAAKMWIHLATCRAAGFNDPGMSKPNRLITYSSKESEYSYEDPSVKHSVFGYYMIVTGMMKKAADKNRNGRVSVEEAYAWARPRTIDRTDERQHPSIIDRLSGSFSLELPKPSSGSRPPSSPSPSPSPSGSSDPASQVLCTVQRCP